MNNILWTVRMSWVAAALIGAIFVLYSLYSGFVYIFFNKHYKGIVFTTKNITYITMLSACAVTTTVVISRIFPITVLPPIRISFEGLMVKIAGFIFGPIVGLISGLVTELLCMLFIPSYFHIAYIIAMASYGFLAGLAGILNKRVKSRKWIIFLISNLFLISFLGSMCFFTLTINGTIELVHGIIVTKYIMISILLISIIIIFTFQSITFILYLVWKKRDEKNNFIIKNAGKVDDTKEIAYIDGDIVGTVFLAIITEYFVSALIVPWGDTTLFSSKGGEGYTGLLLYRLCEAPIKIIANTFIIYVAYRTTSPLINRD